MKKNKTSKKNKVVKRERMVDVNILSNEVGETREDFADRLEQIASEIKKDSKDARIQEVLDRSVEEHSKMTLEGISEELGRISDHYKEDVNIINAIADSHIFETEVVIKNTELGTYGLANNSNAMRYCNEYERHEGQGPLFGAQHISELAIQINVKDMIVNGYRYRKYNRKEKEDLAGKLGEKMCRKHCSNILEDFKYEVTDEVIKLSITGINENLPIMNFEEYGLQMDKYINSFQEVMKESRVNRAYVKFEFDNHLALMRK